ncbi:class I SAM-dependent methyltransferase [Herbidospora cretacea]|uniref:class I SAM-dependent methyltransferase n=1 Tax=Herbidospora cretacea TaxID=28444 RepID=UPI0006915C1D|nr:class I SAM-dependent methyltransferase [Herbidospora cretacea]
MDWISDRKEDAVPPRDDDLFKGAADYYELGRLPYSARLPEVLAKELGLGPGSVLADIGCGPGLLAVALAPFCGRVVGVDPDPDMLARGRRRDPSVTWIRARAEDLAFEPGELDAAVFGRSFHWTDRALMAARLRTFVRPGGHLVLVSEMHRPGRIPPRVKELVAEFLGEYRVPRLGDEEEIIAAAGWQGPKRLTMRTAGTLTRDPETRIAEVYSMSSSTRHRFGARLPEFDRRLRELLSEPEVIPFPATLARIWTNP